MGFFSRAGKWIFFFKKLKLLSLIPLSAVILLTLRNSRTKIMETHKIKKTYMAANTLYD
jgi:hypothetical protein